MSAVTYILVCTFYFDVLVILSPNMHISQEQEQKKNQIMTNNTNEMTNKNQCDEFTPLGIGHVNTTKEKGVIKLMLMLLTTTMIQFNNHRKHYCYWD